MAETRTLLWEIGCEELPAWSVEAILRQLPKLVEDALVGAHLVDGEHAPELEVFAGPRRFSVRTAVLAEQPSFTRTVTGPPAKIAFEGGDPAAELTRAGAGFLAKSGATREDATVNAQGLLSVEQSYVGQPAAAVLPTILPGVIESLKFAKPMRWGSQPMDASGAPAAWRTFVRPIRWIVTLLDDESVPYSLWGVESGGTSRSHRFLGAEREFSGFTADGYEDALAAHHVVASQVARRSTIHDGLDAAATELGGEWFDPGHVLDEVVHLVEAPTVVTGHFPERYLELWSRVLITAMQSHQRYVPVREPGDRGALRPAFLAVMNGDPAALASIMPGYERVLTGRLDDAVFSVGRDRERGIDDMASSLGSVVFHAKAGSLADRTDRISAIALHLAGQLGIDQERAGTAALLAKADQVSVLVGEFAELEGFAGARYAETADYPDDVVLALEQQFLPRSAEGGLPSPGLPSLLAIADKLDLLLTMFSIGEAPTGSRDPHGLRRAAMGVARTILEHDLSIDVDAALAEGLRILVDQGFGTPPPGIITTLRTFIADRVEKSLTDSGVRVDAVRAARAADGLYLQQIVALSRTLDGAVGAADPDFLAVLEALKRCVNLVDGARDQIAQSVSEMLFEPADAALAEAVQAIAHPLRKDVEAHDYEPAITLAATLGPAVTRFFDREQGVKVMADDPDVRANRLALLDTVIRTLEPLGDLTQLQIG